MSDWSLHLYRQPDTRIQVEDFYNSITKNKAITQAILRACAHFEVSPALAFALANTESEFNPRARGKNPDSIDYGLFQLNSRSYPELTPDKAYNPDNNAWIGVAHLKEALTMGGGPSRGVAIYNAGPTRVFARKIPASTQAYTSKILSMAKDYEGRFLEHLLSDRLASTGTKAAKSSLFLLDTAPGAN